MESITVSKTIGGKTFQLETGYLAKQADGSALCTINETVVFAAATTADPRPGINFFPLSVDYREKTQAAGKFPGGFMKREGRPTTKEVLTCRLIDRPVRPMFPELYKDEVQVCSFVVQVDGENDPDIAAMNASFAALHLADIPFIGPLGAVRVGHVGDRFVINPDFDERKQSDLDIIIAGNHDSISMVEGTCAEISEDLFLEALDFAHGFIRKICDLMDELRKKSGKTYTEWEAPSVETPSVVLDVESIYGARLEKALRTPGKMERKDAVKALLQQAISEFVPEGAEDADELTSAIKKCWHELEGKVTRAMLLRGERVDGRDLNEIRPIHIKAGWQSRLHGSAIFTRGETQALVVCTLGTPKDQQIVDGLDEEYSKKFDFQYNFPPYSVGEVKPIRGVSRREIGHGNLAERALMPVLPEPQDFPYTIRLISDILESNGSSSMASVCGGTLAMMDAGVPLKQPVAGIAMGLLKDEETDDFVVLSDILGSEDHHGDMDFKVAGTGRGITAVQMDIKVKGISKDVMQKALSQAKEGRLHILKTMMKALPMPSEHISEYAPRLLIVSIPVDKIGLVIGPGGKTIKKIQETTGARVEIEDDGTVHISSRDAGAAEDARRQIEMLTAEVEVGQVYKGRIVSVKDFGVFVELLPGQEGLCHVSELSNDYISKVEDVVKMGDVIEVKVIARDEQGRIKLSRKALLEGGEGGGESGGRREERGGRPPRGGDRDRGRGGDRDRDRGRGRPRGDGRGRGSGDRPPRRREPRGDD